MWFSKITGLKNFSVACLFTFALTSCNDQTPNTENTKPLTPVEYIPQVSIANAGNATGILVKFRNSVGGAGRARSLDSAGLVARGNFNLVPGLTRAEPRPGFTVEQTLLSLATDTSVAYAEPDYILSIDAFPNDPQFAQQYALNNNAQTGGATGADISAVGAWDMQTGSDSVIAIIDTGVDYNHEDLRENIWINVAEIPDNGIDDDNNGYIDDTRGWNFNSDNNDPLDDNNHGTHAAGTIGAKGNNNIGITGVNWNVRIMPLKFMNARGIGSTSAAIRALEYAVNNGARISNNSWGGGAYSQALYDAIQSAHVAGHMFIAAAGNTGNNNDTTAHYPGSFNLSNIISVAGSNDNDQLAGFSNYGALSVDLVAPGANIFSTIRNSDYRSMSGTSMAAPYVSGVVGLLLAENPSLSIAEIRAALLNSVDQNSALFGKVASSGRLNAQAALAYVQSPQHPIPAPPPGSEVHIVANVSEVAIGASVQLSAEGGTPPYTWAVDSPAYASVDVNTGVFTGLTVGTVFVVATDSLGVASTGYQITLIPMEILPKDLSRIQLSETRTFNANGGVGPYLWSVDDSSVVEILPSGTDNRDLIVTPLKTGFFQITLNDTTENIATTGMIEVFVPDLVVSPTSVILNIGDTQQLLAQGGTSPYNWSSSDNAVVTVDSVGMISAAGPGTASITLTDFENRKVSVSVTVVADPVPALQLAPVSANLVVNETIQISASGGVAPYTWSSSDLNTASVNNTGLVTALAAGTVVITAQDASGQSASMNITITAQVPALKVSPASAKLSISETLQLIASDGVQPYSWTSSNSAIATVSATGLVTAISTGNVTVTVQDSDGQALQVVITVNPSVPTLTVNPPTINLQINDAVQLQVQGGTAPYNYRSSNNSIASVNSSGLITALAAGSAIITVQDNAVQSQQVSVAVTVVSAPPLQVSPSSASLQVNESLQLQAQGGTAPYRWTSSNNNIVAVSNSGLITAIGVGTASITLWDSSNQTQIIDVTVTTAPVTSNPVTIIEKNVILAIAEQRQLTATGGDQNYSWSSSNPIVADVATGGLITAFNSGFTTITVTDGKGASASVSVEVRLVRVTAALNTIAVGDVPLQMGTSGGVGPISWSVSDVALASVDSNGLLTAVAAGVVTITATDRDGFSGTMDITITSNNTVTGGHHH